MEIIKTFIAEVVSYWQVLTSVLAIVVTALTWFDRRKERKLDERKTVVEIKKLDSETDVDEARELNLIGSTYAELLNQLKTENSRLRGLEQKVETLSIELQLERANSKNETAQRLKLEKQVEAILTESVSQSMRIQQVESENTELKKVIAKLQAHIKQQNELIAKYELEATLKNNQKGIL